MSNPALELALALIQSGAVTREQILSSVAGTELGDRLKGALGGPAGAPRYRLRDELGRGGLGRVVEAWDGALEREVAVKLALEDANDEVAARFTREARLAARLEHPNIVPVFDFGRWPGEGTKLFLTMKRVRGRDLAKVLGAIASGDTELRRAWTRLRLLQVFQAICLGVAFAHDRGIVHRDLKPANVMLGTFGEVYVVDWGLARVVAEAPDDGEGGASKGSRLTLEGEIVGTPCYMSPEQAEARPDVDQRSDVYALGAILYEMLTLRPPYDGADPHAILENVKRGGAPAPSAVLAEERSRRARKPGGPATSPTQSFLAPLPTELDAICLKALALDPADRHATAMDLHDEVQEFLEGERVRRLADAAAERAADAIRRLAQLRQEARRASEEAKERADSTEPHAEKAELWRAQDRAAELETGVVEAWAEAEAQLSVALGHDGGHEDARRLKTDLHWERFREAETRGDRREMVLARRVVEQFHDGSRARELKGDGRATIRAQRWDCACLRDGRMVEPAELATRAWHPMSGRERGGRSDGLTALEPAKPVRLRVHGAGCAARPVEGARVWLWRYEETGRLAVPVTPKEAPAAEAAPVEALFEATSPVRPRGPGLFAGRTPVENFALPMGSYLAIVAADGLPPARVPIHIAREGDATVEVTLSAEGPKDSVLVPGGVFPYQGDRGTSYSNEESLEDVPAFWISRFPVTCRDYAGFLNAVPDAARHAPRSAREAKAFWPGPPWRVPAAGEGLKLPSTDADWQDDWPVLGVSWQDAMTYAAWRRECDGFLYTLLEERQFEKAARGTDRRVFPWGNSFDDRWTNGNRSHAGGPRPEPVRAFPADESPYGVRGLAGNARTPCLNDPGPEYAGWRCFRGGTWADSAVCARSANRAADPHDGGTFYINGIRLAALFRL